MSLFKIVTATLCVSLLASCGSIPSTFQYGTDSALVFSPTQWRFPSQIAGFRRDAVIPYDRDGLDCSVAYNHPSLIAATVYVYPGRTSLITEERMVVEEIARRHQGSRPAIRSNAAFGGHDGVRLGHVYHGIFAYRPQVLRSQTLIFRIKDTFLKFRITYPEAASEAAELHINRFLAEYPWP